MGMGMGRMREFGSTESIERALDLGASDKERTAASEPKETSVHAISTLFQSIQR
jgi:hypothetical protein